MDFARLVGNRLWINSHCKIDIVPLFLAVLAAALIGPSFAIAEESEELQPTAIQAYVEIFDVSEQIAEERLATQEEGASIVGVLMAAEGGDYAGVWFDNDAGEFVIPMLPAANEEDVADALEDADIELDGFQVESATSSWDQLEAAQDQLDTNLSALIASGAVSTSLDAEENAVVVTTADADALESDATDALDAAGEADYETKVVFSESTDDNLRMATEKCTFETKDCDAPFRGGVRMEPSSPPGGFAAIWCTSGFNATTPSGNRYVLTAGHCAHGVSEVKAKQANGQQHYLGHIDAGHAIFPYHDIAAIQVAGSYWLTAPWEDIVANWGESQEWKITNEAWSFIGEMACHLGGQSGKSCGAVRALNITRGAENAPGSPSLEHLTQFGPMTSISGDSGGSVFTGGGRYALGIFTGSDPLKPSVEQEEDEYKHKMGYYTEITEDTDLMGVRVAPRIGGPPSAVTGTASFEFFRTVTLSGAINANSVPTEYFFQYGPTTAYGQVTPTPTSENAGHGSGFIPVSVNLTGLKSAETYHYRIVARSAAGTTYGADQAITPNWRPAVNPAAPTYPVPHEAQLGGTVNPEGGPTTYQVEFGPTTAYGTTKPVPAASIGSGTSPVAVSQAFTGLKGQTTYHFRIVATNDEGTTTSPDQAFTTPDWKPLVATKHASGITEEEATLEGKVNPQLRATTYQFEYGETKSYGTTVPASPASAGSGNAFLNVNERIGGLKPETLYYYRIKATNEEGTSYSDVYTFETFTTKGSPSVFSLSFGGHGSGNGQLDNPRGIAVDGAGNVWVADTGNDRVVEFDPDGQFLRAVGVEGDANEKLDNPVDVAIDESGAVWVGEEARLVSYSDQGQYLSSRSLPSSLGPLNSLTVGEGQRVIASHEGGQVRLMEYLPGGGWSIVPNAIGGAWGWWNQLQPTGLAANASREKIFVVDEFWLGQSFDQSGKYRFCTAVLFGGMNEFGSAEGQVDSPQGIAVRPSGNVLVADTGNERVQQFSPQGEVLGAFSPDAAESEAAAPIDIAVGPGGTEYITTTSSGNQIEKWLQPAAPEAATGEATEVQAKQATVKGIVNPVGRATTYKVEYGTAAPYRKAPTPAASAGVSFTPQQASVTLAGLAPETTYSYRIVATNKQATIAGEWKTFTTKPPNEVLSPEEVEELQDEAEQIQYEDAFGSTGTATGKFSHPANVEIDAQGNLWVADMLNNRIQKFDSEGKYLSSFGGFSWSPEPGKFICPSALAFDAQGNLWVLDRGNNRLQQFNSKGEFLKSVGSFGNGNGQFFSPEGIAIDGKGNIWVSDTNNGRIQRLNSKGEFIDVVNPPGLGAIEPKGMDVGPGGRIWVADWSHRVVAFDEAGGLVRSFGAAGSGEGELEYADAVEADAYGHVWVADSRLGQLSRVQLFSQSGQYIAQLGSHGTGEGQLRFRHPFGLAADGHGSLWVTDPENNRVQRWRVPPTSYIQYEDAFGSTGTATGKFSHPANVEIDAQGNLWVADMLNNRIQKFDSEGKYLSSFGGFSWSPDPGKFICPSALAFDANGNLWVVDRGNNRLQQFNSKGEFLKSVGSFGNGNGQFFSPEGIAIDGKGNIWVSDTNNGRIQRLNSKGEFIDVVNPPGLGAIEPKGMDVGPGGRIWVADWSHRVVAFDEAGGLVRSFGAAGSGEGELEYADAVEADAYGHVWVADSRLGQLSRVQLFSQSGQYIAQLGSHGTGEGQLRFRHPFGLAADSHGSLWVTDPENNRVQRWRVPPVGF